MKNLTFTILCIFGFYNISIASTPCLLFSKSDIPKLKQKAASEPFKERWDKFLRQADDLCDPCSKRYADPGKVIAGFDNVRIAIRGHKFGRRLVDQMEMLGMAYQFTGNQKYSDHGIKILTAYAKELPVSQEYMTKTLAGGRGEMMRGLATGYDMFAENMTASQKAEVLSTAKGYLDKYLLEMNDPNTWWRTYHNFNGVCGGPAGCIALLLKDTDPNGSKEYVAKVEQFLTSWLNKGFDEQGAYMEGVSYSFFALDNVFIFADALRHSGGDNLYKHPALKKAVNFYALSILPGEDVADARNDSPYMGFQVGLLRLAKENNSGVAKWLYRGDDKEPLLELIWSNDVPKVSPTEAGVPLSEHFKGRGLCVWRTGWENNDVMFSIEAGKYHPVTHNHADKGHFTFYGLGHRWAVDGAYGRYETASHNCILIDGQGQAKCGGGMGSDGIITAYEDTEKYGYALADCTEAYRTSIDIVDGKETSIERMKLDHALRHTLFVKKADGNPAYAVVLDDIAQDEKSHEYCWQMLTWPDMKIQVNGFCATVIPETTNSQKPDAQMKLYMDGEKLVADTYLPGDKRNPESYPRIKAVSQTRNPYFAAVLVPLSSNQKTPEVQFANSATQKKIIIKFANRYDTIIWSKDAKEKPKIVFDKR